MIVINRFRVPAAQQDDFVARATAALQILSGRPGWTDGEIGQNIDEPELWTMLTRWEGVGSYRRALGGYDAKLHVVPLLSLTIDEPSAYLGLDERDGLEPDRPSR